MNKIILPSIFVAVLFVATFFAVMPVEKATTVHTTITTSRLPSVTLNLDGLPAGALIVVLDTTPNSMGQAHIAALLPVAEAGVADDCETEAPLAGLTIQAGSAPTIGSVITGADNTGITGRTNVGGTTNDMCVFHRTITAANTPATTLTDIVVINGTASPLPDDSVITVTAKA